MGGKKLVDYIYVLFCFILNSPIFITKFNINLEVNPVFFPCNNCLRLLFSLKPKEMAELRLLAIWIDQR